MEALFGFAFWDHVVLGVTHWSYDKESIEKRTKENKTEEWWKAAMNTQLQEHFHVNRTIEVSTNDIF